MMRKFRCRFSIIYVLFKFSVVKISVYSLVKWGWDFLRGAQVVIWSSENAKCCSGYGWKGNTAGLGTFPIRRIKILSAQFAHRTMVNPPFFLHAYSYVFGDFPMAVGWLWCLLVSLRSPIAKIVTVGFSVQPLNLRLREPVLEKNRGRVDSSLPLFIL